MDALLQRARQLDADDPLKGFRERFELPDGLVYLDGNSLGALPKATPARLQSVVAREWGEGLIGSWNDADWVDLPRRLGDKIGRLIGAGKGETLVCDSVSINIFKALTAALSLWPERAVILTEEGNFPTDHYMMQGLARFSGGKIECRAVPREAVEDALTSDVAAVLLTHVHYQTGEMWDMAGVTARAHDAGALAIWDLSHSVGAMPLDLLGSQADFAVGCGYKYLNGGPGAPAFLSVAERHQSAQIVLSGWFGHARPFAFEETYEPAGGIERFQSGTPGILGMAALESGVDLMLEADLGAVRAKSLGLGDLLIDAMLPVCEAYGFELVTPQDHSARGSHISYRHENAYEITQALIARGVVGDYREPGILRLGLTPLYTRYADIVRAVMTLAEVCSKSSWDRDEYRVRGKVT